MTEYSPQTLFDLYNAIHARISSAVLDGILGDANHTWGYHRGRNWLIASGRDGASDYSIQSQPDKLGDGDAASAIDIGLPPNLMIECTTRLITAAKARDPRLHAVRELCGTTDGTNTHPYDLSDGQDGPLNSWDSSHLTHIHLSIYREYSNDFAALAGIADVFAGIAPAPTPVVGKDEPMICVAAPNRGIGELVPGGRATLTKARWTAIQNLRAKGASIQYLPQSNADWDATPEKNPA